MAGFVSKVFQFCWLPVNTEDHQQEGGEDVAACPDHHQDLAEEVGRVPLSCVRSISNW